MTMQAIIPDTMQGALILSVIDFFASFVIISGIGVVLSLFPLLNRLRKAPAAAPKAAAARAPAAAEGPPPEHLAVIAAAVHTVLGGAQHIVRIEPAHGGSEWAAEGRLAHHASHALQGPRQPAAGPR